MSNSEFYIPIEDAKEQFIAHLKANPRTILSAKFGDGKSYFLNSIMEDNSDKFEFLSLYPVNYQVVANCDIFELIKRDILFQLMIHEMISDRVVVTNEVALSFFIQKNGISLPQELIPYISEIALSQKESAKVIFAFKGLKIFKDLKDKFEKFKAEYDEDEKVDQFLQRVEKGFLYEDDIVTNLIRKSIDDYRRRTKKKVVLVIEDLDRIDPAHLFRVLNVFSAHMDTVNKYGIKANDSLAGNKFGLDNVVMVIDFNNMKKIFHHFYGPDTNFKGYIGKFISSTPFYYSLKEEREKYIIQELVRITSAPESMVRALISTESIENLTLRDIVKSFDIEKQIIEKPIYRNGEKVISINTTILKILSVMRRLGFDQDTINNALLRLLRKDIGSFYKYAAPFIFLSKDSQYDGLTGMVILGDDDGNLRGHSVELDPSDGSCHHLYDYNNYEEQGTNLINLCVEMQKYISK